MLRHLRLLIRYLCLRPLLGSVGAEPSASCNSTENNTLQCLLKNLLSNSLIAMRLYTIVSIGNTESQYGAEKYLHQVLRHE